MIAMFMFRAASNPSQVISEADFPAPLGKEQGYAAWIKDPRQLLCFQNLDLCEVVPRPVHGSLSISGVEKFVSAILGTSFQFVGDSHCSVRTETL